MQEWLNDTTVDGFLGNLREPEKFIKMNSKWNASQMSDTSKPPSENEGGTIVEDVVGLLNIYEYSTSYRGINASKGYLNNESSWKSLTPYNSSMTFEIDINGAVSNNGVTYSIGIRPSINLKSEIKIVDGDGSSDNPYRLEGDNDVNLGGVKLNTRYSGEYISFGTGENSLYRIVSHETEGLTKITSAEPLKENGTFKTMTFGDSVYYSSTNTIGSFLNGEYLNSGTYLTSEQVNMIEDNTVWYLGTVGQGNNYILAKYKDVNMSNLTTNITTVKVGLLRLGELMSSQFSKNANNIVYWNITPTGSGLYIWSIRQNSGAFVFLASNAYGIKPAFNLKSNVIITGGDGTLQNPFTLALE